MQSKKRKWKNSRLTHSKVPELQPQQEERNKRKLVSEGGRRGVEEKKGEDVDELVTLNY